MHNSLREQAAIQGAVLHQSYTSDVSEAAHADGRISKWELDFYWRILGQSRLSEKQLGFKRGIETSLGGTPPAVLWPHRADAVQAASRDGRISAWDRQFYLDNMDITSLRHAIAPVILKRKR